MTTSTLNIGDMVSVLIDGVCTNNNALLTYGFGGDVVEATDKAVRIVAETENGKVISAWFPRRAFNKITDSGNFGNQPAKRTSLARWFKPNGWTARFIELASRNETGVYA